MPLLPPSLSAAARAFRNHPLNVQLTIAELVHRLDVTRSRHNFHVAVLYLPAGRTAENAAPSGQIFAIKEDNRIRGRVAESFTGHEDGWLRALGIVHSPFQPRQERRVFIARLRHNAQQKRYRQRSDHRSPHRYLPHLRSPPFPKFTNRVPAATPPPRECGCQSRALVRPNRERFPQGFWVGRSKSQHPQWLWHACKGHCS